MLTEAGLLQDLVGAAVRWDDVRLSYLWWRSKEKWLRSRVRVHFWWITPERHGEEGEPVGQKQCPKRTALVRDVLVNLKPERNIWIWLPAMSTYPWTCAGGSHLSM